MLYARYKRTEHITNHKPGDCWPWEWWKLGMAARYPLECTYRDECCQWLRRVHAWWRHKCPRQFSAEHWALAPFVKPSHAVDINHATADSDDSLPCRAKTWQTVTTTQEDTSLHIQCAAVYFLQCMSESISPSGLSMKSNHQMRSKGKTFHLRCRRHANNLINQSH